MSETATPVKGAGKARKELDRAVIRFAGDSGDGMQLTGEQFTTESAWAGNDLATARRGGYGSNQDSRTVVQK